MAILPLQLARVSNSLRMNVASSSITRTQQSLLDVQNQLTTGYRVNSPSDDPGDAAVIQQLQKLLEYRTGYQSNLEQSKNQLSQTDSVLSGMSDLLLQAQSVASANVGSDVSADGRANAAEVIQSIYSQMYGLGNTKYQNQYIFGGTKADQQPFVEANGGVQFVGSTTVLASTVDAGTNMSFMVGADQVFGAVSSAVKGNTDLSPKVTTTTRLGDMRGATLAGVAKGSILVSDGTNSRQVDISTADSLGDVINLINNPPIGVISASLNAAGTGLTLTGGAGDNLTIADVGTGTTAAQLGIAATGAGTTVVGSNLNATVTGLTNLADLKPPAGIDLTNSMTITNGLNSATIDPSTCTTVEDLLNKINGANIGVRAQLNTAKTGIDIQNVTSGLEMSISENGGTLAADLGVRSLTPSTTLAELNGGTGVQSEPGNDIHVELSDGTGFDVDVDGATTMQDVIDAFNTAATAAGAGATFTAQFSSTGNNGLELRDTSGGAGSFAATAINYSPALGDLGLGGAAAAGVIKGEDVNTVQPTGVFSDLSALMKALQQNDAQAITAAAEKLQSDYSQVVRVRGTVGARVKDVESRLDRMADENISTQSLLSGLHEVDYNQAITRYSSLQVAIEAAYRTAGTLLESSLMDFLS